MIEPIHSSSKIRNIETLPDKRGDILARVLSTWFGRFYTNHVKQHAVAPQILEWIWRHCYLVYATRVAVHFSGRKEKRWRPLIRLSDFTRKRELPIHMLADKAFVETPKPEVFPACDQGYLASPHDRYEFPEIFVTTVKNAIAYGGTNLVLVDDEVICHDLYDFRRDYTSEELHGRTLINPRSTRIRWLLHDKKPDRVPAAAVFVDACAPNYAHWLTEVLPRITLFCLEKRFRDVPIVVNSGLHKNIMESLFLAAGPEREIIVLPVGRALHCDELYIASVTGYVPFERRNNSLSGHSHGVFSPLAFNALLGHPMLGLQQNAKDSHWPKKIFLRRNSEIRNVVNATELERMFFSHGYSVVEPERMTFSQQVKLFSNARAIAGSSGAALANIIFCPPITKICIFISKDQETSYWYWQNMACATGKTVTYVLGEKNKSKMGGIHASFSIDLNSLPSSILGVK
ncbi:MAG: hypothetical protein A4E62_02085 [Syntrophorhabdus sp. PtaU1.Bin002]|nr:MAG: hypothetical protein A4E62_02085 [Syntrophorhabdus sp. PtaU1.Bin002]